MKDKKYHTVRKVAWDSMWHVMYKVGKHETWDRVTQAEAMKIAKKLVFSPANR
jgi:hypothetical protein